MAHLLSCKAQYVSVAHQQPSRSTTGVRAHCVSLLQRPAVHRQQVHLRKSPKLRPGSLQVVNGLVRQVTAKELEEAIPARKVPLIIDFYATWCGPCVLLAKELESVASELGPEKVEILKLDTDQHPEISTQLQIQGLPTMVFIGMDKSKPALRTEGLLPASTIKDIIENQLAAVESAPSA